MPPSPSPSPPAELRLWELAWSLDLARRTAEIIAAAPKGWREAANMVR